MLNNTPFHSEQSKLTQHILFILLSTTSCVIFVFYKPCFLYCGPVLYSTESTASPTVQQK